MEDLFQRMLPAGLRKAKDRVPELTCMLNDVLLLFADIILPNRFDMRVVSYFFVFRNQDSSQGNSRFDQHHGQW